MSEHTGAQIIPFPTAKRLEVKRADATRAVSPPPVPAGAVKPEERLTNALAALSTALGEQEQAVKRWQSAMHSLAHCMQSLSTGLPKPESTGKRPA